jgi:hypothetical protein
LSQPGQKLVELRLVSEESVDGLIIQNVTLVERSEGEGYRCSMLGDASIWHTVFRVKKWD